MRTLLTVASLSALVLATAACGLTPDPPLAFPDAAFSGTGDRMTKCMMYASESYCESEIWGGGGYQH